MTKPKLLHLFGPVLQHALHWCMRGGSWRMCVNSCVCLCFWIMTGCGSTEGFDNSLGCEPQGMAGRHSAVLTVHSHITECLTLSPALLCSLHPRTATTTHLHYITFSPSFCVFKSPILSWLFSLSTFLSNGAELTMVQCCVNPLWLSSGPQCSTWAPLELLSLTCSTNPAVCLQTHTCRRT